MSGDFGKTSDGCNLFYVKGLFGCQSEGADVRAALGCTKRSLPRKYTWGGQSCPGVPWGRLSGGSCTMSEPSWPAEGRLKAGCSQEDWLPHKAAHIFIIRCDAAGVMSNLCHCLQAISVWAASSAGCAKGSRDAWR